MPNQKIIKDKNGLITVREVARRLSLHENTVRAYAKSGVLPSVKLENGYTRFDPAVVGQFVKKMGTKEEELIEASEAAIILNVHRNTIRAYAQKGLLKSKKLPGSHYLRYKKSDVEALKEQLAAFAADSDLKPSEPTENSSLVDDNILN